MHVLHLPFFFLTVTPCLLESPPLKHQIWKIHICVSRRMNIIYRPKLALQQETSSAGCFVLIQQIVHPWTKLFKIPSSLLVSFHVNLRSPFFPSFKGSKYTGGGGFSRKKEHEHLDPCFWYETLFKPLKLIDKYEPDWTAVLFDMVYNPCKLWLQG